ncbi:ATP-dependent DNA helicase DinG [Fontimonas thermophila]|uniref:ATP-dependent DNA helicase DinG n=1 Tax=Fontimonas thermophila TaxID=1076937 RepID=A0A1I2HY88_9GAMM|nr:ATP-dependent DNA helicase [Fontimonas thermophila]SFF33606.1 ATP-dependent DNA helicase DinG [Fontimonas thermophila]
MNRELGAQVAAALASGGVLERHLPDFAPRVVQQRMADRVARTLASRTCLVIEAGTGTGKTYAYLVPALLSGLRTVVSTGTHTLQDQLFHRDLPRVRAALASPVRVALLKGRTNYLCLHRMKRARGLPLVRDAAQIWQKIETWARRTETGELSELGDFREESSLMRQITSTPDNCLGSRCGEFEHCFVARARRQAQAAHLVVVNHHLLFADFLLKDQGFGQILSGADAVIVDEAHQLPELAAQFFGCRVSTRQIHELAGDVQLDARNCGDLPDLVECAQRLSADVEQLERCFRAGMGRLPLQVFMADGEVRGALTRVRQSIEDLYQALRPLEERNAELSSDLERALTLRDNWTHILEGEAESATTDEVPTEVRWVEPLTRGGSFHATPIEQAEGFRRMRQTYPGAWIFTSATLASGADFTHYTRALGLDEAETVQLDSPFDYARQARLYLPGGLPDPNASDYAQAVAEAALPVIQAAQGGAFVLCTSHRAVRTIAGYLRAHLSCRLLVQGEDARSALLDAFVADGNAVLVGTSSFWEGVDVRGPALRVVVIDRLPFAAPGDPVLEARRRAIQARGGNPFRELQLPEAIVTLRQGIGRLIRDPDDRGLLMLCDPRLTEKSYGRQVLAALPSMPLLRDLDAVRHWLSEMTRRTTAMDCNR